MITTDSIVKDQGRSQADILIDLGSFLIWAMDEGARYGDTSAETAVDAFQELLGWDEATMTKFASVIRGKFDHE